MHYILNFLNKEINVFVRIVLLENNGRKCWFSTKLFFSFDKLPTIWRLDHEERCL